MSIFFDITKWYWHVQDSSPGSQVYSTPDNGFVVLADTNYVAWLALGNIPTTIDTIANLYGAFNEFSLSSFRRSVLNTSSAVDVTLTNWAPSFVAMNMTASSKKMILPRMNSPMSIPIGQPLQFYNSGSNSFDIYANDGTTNLVTLTAAQLMTFILSGNTTRNGTLVGWRQATL